MELASRISAAKSSSSSSEGTSSDLQQENKLIPIIGAKRFFGPHVILLLLKNNGPAILCLNKEISDVFSDQDIADIESRKCRLFLIYKNHNCGCNNCQYYDIVSA
jgi:hypothetical protein